MSTPRSSRPAPSRDLSAFLVVPDAELHAPTPSLPAATVSPAAVAVGGGTLRWVRLGDIHVSPYQTRLRDDPEAVATLAEDIAADTLLSPPQARPHPERRGALQLTFGHRRVAALRLLAARRLQHPALQLGETVDDTAVPVLVTDADDVTAHRRTVAENLVRESLSPWEHVVALADFVEHLEATGARTSVRPLAELLGVRRPTMEKLLRVARALSPEVLRAAMLIGPDTTSRRDADPNLLAALPMAGLDRVAHAATVADRAARLNRELERVGARREATGTAVESPAAPWAVPSRREQEVQQEEPSGVPVVVPAEVPVVDGAANGANEDNERIVGQGLVVDIRQPLHLLAPPRARRQLLRLARALPMLARAAAAALSGEDRDRLRTHCERALRALD